MAKTIVVTIHGQCSVGKNMAMLNDRLDAEDFMDDCIFINLRYTKLPSYVNTMPWVRTMTAKYISARLNAICEKFPDAQIIVICHSNGCRATKIAMDTMLRPKKNWPKFRIDNLLLLGCPIKRNYNWAKHPQAQVVNFYSTNDKVVWLARFYGMGGSGRWGFKPYPGNLRQIKVRWGHSGFMKKYDTIRDEVRRIVH